MLRHRMIAIVWVIGAILTLTALIRTASRCVGISRIGKHSKSELFLAQGNIYFDRYSRSTSGEKSWYPISYGIRAPNWLALLRGRFHWGPSNYSRSGIRMILPIWVVFLPFTALCLLFHYRNRRAWKAWTVQLSKPHEGERKELSEQTTEDS